MLQRNVFANLLSNVWGVVSIFLLIPLYISFLGIEAYGLIGFFATLIGVLSLADMGFTVTLKREMARQSAVGNINRMKDILRTYEVVYGLISLSIATFIFILAPLIVDYWLHTNSFSAEEMIVAIRLMGIAIALQLPSGLFVGGIMGLQYQVLANVLNIGVSVLRGVGAILVLWLFSPTIFVFFIWQLLSNLIYLIVSRYILWDIISKGAVSSKGQFKLDVLRDTGRFALSMASMTLIGVLLNQTDKLIVGKFTSLQMFSYYSVAGTLASIPIVLSGSIGSALFPKFTEIVALANKDTLKEVYNWTCEIVGVLIIPSGIVLVFFSSEFIFAWTGSSLIAANAKLTASFLLLGQIMQAITIIPYNFALAHGNVKFSQKLGIISIFLITPLLFILTLKYGILGAGISWFVLNCITLPINMYYLHRQVLSLDGMWKYCLRGVIRPLLITIPFVLLGKGFLPEGLLSRFSIFLYIGIIWIVPVLLSLLSFPAVRLTFFKAVETFFNKVRNAVS